MHQHMYPQLRQVTRTKVASNSYTNVTKRKSKDKNIIGNHCFLNHEYMHFYKAYNNTSRVPYVQKYLSYSCDGYSNT